MASEKSQTIWKVVLSVVSAVIGAIAGALGINL